MTSNGKMYPTHHRILKLLEDGERHHRKEVHKCLDDELSRMNTLHYWISTLRTHLRPKGETVICELVGYGIYYRHVRLLGSAAE